MVEAEPKENITQKNWADEDEGDEDADDVEIGGSSVAKVAAKPMERTIIPEKGPPKPREQRERNIHGDFVITKITIKEQKIEIPKADDEEDESEEEEESEEEQQAAPEQEEEQKKGKRPTDYC